MSSEPKAEGELDEPTVHAIFDRLQADLQTLSGRPVHLVCAFCVELGGGGGDEMPAQFVSARRLEPRFTGTSRIAMTIELHVRAICDTLRIEFSESIFEAVVQMMRAIHQAALAGVVVDPSCPCPVCADQPTRESADG